MTALRNNVLRKLVSTHDALMPPRNNVLERIEELEKHFRNFGLDRNWFGGVAAGTFGVDGSEVGGARDATRSAARINDLEMANTRLRSELDTLKVMMTSFQDEMKNSGPDSGQLAALSSRLSVVESGDEVEGITIGGETFYGKTGLWRSSL